MTPILRPLGLTAALRRRMRVRSRKASALAHVRRRLGYPPGRSRWLRDRPRDAPTRVHVGAGMVSLPGWVNTDVDGTADYYLDVIEPWPLDDGSITHVFADNVIEHLAISDGRRFLANVRAALRPGGTVRLVTPDVRASALAYCAGDMGLTRIMERHRRHGYEVLYPVDVLRILFSESGHHDGYLYDELCLSEELTRAGFIRIRRFDPGISSDPVLTGLDARVEAADALIFMSIEATSP